MSDSLDKVYNVILEEVKIKDFKKVLSSLDSSGEISSGGVCGAGCEGTSGSVCGAGCNSLTDDVFDPKGISGITKQDLEIIKHEIPQLKKRFITNLENIILEYPSELEYVEIKNIDHNGRSGI